MKVIIIGAGISGLTAAHELVEKGFEVEVYEKGTVAGGMARSTRTAKDIPSEHSWRGYGPFYYNTFEIMSRIPIDRKLSDYEKNDRNIITYKGEMYDITEFVPKHPGGSIINKALKSGDPLEKVWKQNNVEWHMKNPYILKLLEKYKVGSKVPPDVTDNLAKSGIDFKLLSNEREDTKVSVFDYPYLGYLFVKYAIVNKRRNNETKLIDVVWPLQETSRDYLLEYVSGPGWGFDSKTISTNHFAFFVYESLYSGNHSWQVMNQPTSEAWIDPWVTHLTEKGVKFFYSSKMTEVSPEGAVIDGQLVQGDEYILAIPPKIEKPHDQISFRFGFRKKISFEKHNIAFVLMDSEYNITFYPQDEHWSSDVKLGPVVSLWSGTIINGKNAVKLRPKELLKEVKRQFLQSKYIRDFISEEDIVYEEIFEDWYWSESQQRLVSRNPKWVNSVNEVRELNTTEYPNVWKAGAHTKTTMDVWSMESAVESGKLVSNLILEKYNLKKCLVMSHDVDIGKIDDPFYDLGLPHIIDCFFITLVLFFLFKAIFARKKTNN
jgi:cytochrome b involved in lipid metabolism